MVCGHQKAHELIRHDASRKRLQLEANFAAAFWGRSESRIRGGRNRGENVVDGSLRWLRESLIAVNVALNSPIRRLNGHQTLEIAHGQCLSLHWCSAALGFRPTGTVCVHFARGDWGLDDNFHGA